MLHCTARGAPARQAASGRQGGHWLICTLVHSCWHSEPASEGTHSLTGVHICKHYWRNGHDQVGSDELQTGRAVQGQSDGNGPPSWITPAWPASCPRPASAAAASCAARWQAGSGHPLQQRGGSQMSGAPIQIASQLSCQLTRLRMTVPTPGSHSFTSALLLVWSPYIAAPKKPATR